METRMLIPIQTARTAVASAEDTSAKAQQPATLLPANQRGEAIQKILDALTRHLSGREVLSKDALVRLMEDLARILKFPPLPQEGGRDFVRRLVGFLESMPASDRLLLERQLGGRSLAVRVGLLAELPAIRNGTSTQSGTATPMPAQARDVILRNPSLQTAMPLNPAAAHAPVAGEVALLQAVLRKTFGVGNDADVLEPQGDDMEQAGTAEAPSKGRSEKPAERSETRASAEKPASSPDGAPIDNAAALPAGEGEVEETAPQTVLQPGTDEEAQSADTGDLGAEMSVSDGTNAPIEAETADGMEAAETLEDRDPDGTYGPLPETDENKGQRPAKPTRGNLEARPLRMLSEAIKTLIRDSVALPGDAAGAETRLAADQIEAMNASPSAAKETAQPARATGATVRRHETPDGDNALPSLLDDQAEDTRAAQRAPVEIRSQRPGDEQTMQQVIARLVENGLPREAVPFAIIPYPPAANDVADAEDLAREMPGGTGEDASDDQHGAEEDDNRDEESGEPTGEAVPEDETPEAPDAYDLYRKLGGLG